jgi:hypothetical protein
MAKTINELVQEALGAQLFTILQLQVQLEAATEQAKPQTPVAPKKPKE